MSFNSNPSELLQCFQLEEEDVLCPVSDVHIQDVCISKAIQWHLLPAVLEMINPKKVVSDIRGGGRPDDERRSAFFSEWQRQMGSGATYKKLISALLRIGSREHAEYICQLVKDGKTSQTPGYSSVTRPNDEVEKLKAQLEEKDRRLMELEAKFEAFIANSGQRAPQKEVGSKPVTQSSEEGRCAQAAVVSEQRNTGPQELKIEIGSGNLRGSFGFGKREDYYYPIPKGTVAVKFNYEDLSPNSLNFGDGNGKATLHWRPGDEEAHVHAWVNGTAGAANEVAWTVTAVMIIS